VGRGRRTNARDKRHVRSAAEAHRNLICGGTRSTRPTLRLPSSTRDNTMKTTACIVALALAALCPSATRADTLTFVEDFSDASGEPAFDPLFNHSCVVDDPEGSHWALGTDLRLWLVAGFANTVTFNSWSRTGRL
jgi:hypothetical protein